MKTTLFGRGILLPTLLVLLIWAVAGCEKPGTAADAANGTVAENGQQPPAGNPNMPRTQSIPEDKRSKFNKFPYVELAGGKSLRLEAFDIIIQLTHDKPLFPMTNDQIKWIKEGDADQNMGNFITYVYDGNEISLSSPYISVQYFARQSEECPDCATPAKVLAAFQKMYENRPGFAATQPMEVGTNEGKMALCKEMHVPGIKAPDGSLRAEKYIGYAYVEYSEKWMIGFALTTSSKGEFERCKNPFYNLVATYVELKNFQPKSH